MPPAPSLESRLQAAAWEHCVPLNVTLEITLRCNLRCLHCYNFDRAVPYPRAAQDRELTPDEIFRTSDAVRAAGCLYLAFTGGEALAHPRLTDFVSHAAGQNLAVCVKTNGTLLTPEIAGRLAAAGARSVDISLYGGSAATHDAFTDAPGSFERTLAGARAAAEADLRVRFSFCLMKSNAHEIDAMISIAEGLGVGFNIDPMLTARYDGDRSPTELRLDRDTLEQLYRGKLQRLLPTGECRLDREVQCSCARSVCGISATGDVFPCIGAPIRSGNLREKPFAEIWRDSPELNRIRKLTLDDFPVCKPCPDRPYCRRSSGAVYMNTGNYTGPEPWTCMEAAVLHGLQQDTVARPPA